jgi:hypothetical protein
MLGKHFLRPCTGNGYEEGRNLARNDVKYPFVTFLPTFCRLKIGYGAQAQKGTMFSGS